MSCSHTCPRICDKPKARGRNLAPKKVVCPPVPQPAPILRVWVLGPQAVGMKIEPLVLAPQAPPPPAAAPPAAAATPAPEAAVAPAPRFVGSDTELTWPQGFQLDTAFGLTNDSSSTVTFDATWYLPDGFTQPLFTAQPVGPLETFSFLLKSVGTPNLPMDQFRVTRSVVEFVYSAPGLALTALSSTAGNVIYTGQDSVKANIPINYSGTSLRLQFDTPKKAPIQYVPGVAAFVPTVIDPQLALSGAFTVDAELQISNVARTAATGKLVAYDANGNLATLVGDNISMFTSNIDAVGNFVIGAGETLSFLLSKFVLLPPLSSTYSLYIKFDQALTTFFAAYQRSYGYRDMQGLIDQNYQLGVTLPVGQFDSTTETELKVYPSARLQLRL